MADTVEAAGQDEQEKATSLRRLKCANTGHSPTARRVGQIVQSRRSTFGSTSSLGSVALNIQSPGFRAVFVLCARRLGAPAWREPARLRRSWSPDVVGYSRLAGADEDRTLSRLRGLRSDLIDPAIDADHGRIVKRTGDGSLIEFRSVVDAVRCAIEVQNGLIERNAGAAARSAASSSELAFISATWSRRPTAI